MKTGSLHLLLMIMVTGSTTTITTTTTTVTTAPIKWRGIPEFDLPTTPLPPCHGGREEKGGAACILSSPRPMDWRSAHSFCRGQGGFLIGQDEMTNPAVTKLTPGGVTWTALGPHKGHLQWLTRRPALGQFLRWVGGKKGKGTDCASLHHPSLLFQPLPCSSLLPFLCLLHSPGLEHHSDGDFELRVEVEMDDDGEEEEEKRVVRVEEKAEGWISVREEDFHLLALTCAAHLHSPTASAQPQVFWSKDGVYLPIHAATLLPAAVHDATKSRVAANASLPLLQGTYWCEAWRPGSPAPFVSNKILVTVQGREVLLLHLHARHQSPPLTARSLEARLRDAFASLHGFDDFPIDVASLQENEAESEGLVSARAQVHLPAASVAFTTLLDMLREGRGVERLLEGAGFLASSAAALPTRCRNTTAVMPGGNTVLWPFTAAGRVQPRHHRCEAAAGGLLTGLCRWNYTHGATVLFDASRCQRFDFCPQGYTGLADSFCVSLTPADTWDDGVEAAHGSVSSMSLLDKARLHETGRLKAPSLYDEARRWLAGQQGASVLWLPARRIAPFGPLGFVGPVASDFPIALHDGTRSFNVSWAAGQPAAAHDCLALDTENSQLLTLPCDAALPFLSVLDVRGLLAVPSQAWLNEAPNLLTTNQLCPEGNYTGYPGGEDACFRVFRNETRFSWQDAATMCAGLDAHLPDPSRGFLDWPLRQLLYSHDIPSVWITVPRPRVLREKAARRSTFLNWRADANVSLPHAALTPQGWMREDGEAAKTHVMCQWHVQPPNVTLHVFEDAGTVRVEVRPRDAPTTGRVHCYVNGREVTVFGQGGVLEVDSVTQGYYECRVWTGSPLHLATSNTLLHTRRATHTFSVTLSTQRQYTPAQDDATFSSAVLTAWHPCVGTFVEGVRRGLGDSPGLKVMTDNLYFTPDTQADALLINFHVEIDMREAFDILLESEAAERVTAAQGQLSATPCRAVSIRSSLGCPREEEPGRGINETTLTWPATRGAVAVLPAELCVTEEGEPVTRKCLGDFTRGYHWGDRSGGCTDEPRNVTRQLWEMNQNSSPSDLPSLAALTADGLNLTAADVHFVAQKMQSISREAPVALPDLEFLVETLNNVMEAKEGVFGEVQRVLNTSSILMDAFENITLRVQLPRADEPVRGDRRLVSVERVDATPNSSIVGYRTWRKHEDQDEDEGEEGLQEEEEELVRKESRVDWRRSQVTLILPNDLTRRVAAQEGIAAGRGAAGGRVQLTFAVFRNPKLFQDDTTFPNHTVDGHIVQASYGGHSVAHLRHPVMIYFKIGREGNGSKCVFWDFQENGGRGGWSTEGCWSGDRHGEHQLCLCNHLTSFARLVTFDGVGATGVHAVILDTISIIGCALSIFSLLLVLFTFLLFQKWRRRLSNKILASLATAILCSLVVFLAGIQQTLIPELCRAVAVALHYFILASFGWMLVEAVHQYLKFVKVVGTYIPRFMWKASVCAWGAPLLPIIVVLVYDSTLYDSDQGSEDKICWMSSTTFKFAFLPPLAAIMATNLVLFVLIVHSATCGRVRITSTLSERQLRLTQLRMAVSVFFLLGFTWVFGLLAFWRPSLVFSYLFCISNTLQGFFIFIFHVFRERDARRLWRDFLSVISRDYFTSEPRSLSIQTPRYSGQPSRALDSNSVSYNQHGDGEVSLNPQGPGWDPARGSVRSARTASTIIHSRSSTPPAL
ncbi:uncharacterized protein LOC127008236 [Eriocheir sinensis]|uniref:uncharacterized protein LOC127008236 n=1 Tax=Eriocheir sinensis TaxID=95602 RepID=UPI0021CAA5F1|nr:uncharacterized protein LOC127008236 [Eriocheir sinensis]XP_050735930.1 uncharacterized protein LOC127008236 [Eriocheir sinensis]XP_050735931.1 uncharacterized protein LOC127008236 [Eriocheir sinensis]